jgi:lipase chaperone LimK
VHGSDDPCSKLAPQLSNLEELGLLMNSERCPLQIIRDPRRLTMNLTAEQREQVATELKRIGGDLNLTDDQKEKLHSALAEGREKVAEYLKNNPNTTKADILAKVKAHRDEIRQRVVTFLSPEQLSRWDSEIAKAKEFLGQKVDA